MRWSRRRVIEAIITWAVIAAVLIIVTVLGTTVLPRSLGRVATDFVLMVGLILGMQTFVGNSGIISFGHVSFFGVASYVAALAIMSPSDKRQQTPDLPAFIMDAQWGFWGAIGAVILAVLVWGAISGGVVAKMKAEVASMATLALLVLTYSLIVASNGITRGAQGLASVPRIVDEWGILISTLVIAGVALLYAASPWGLRLQAIREDESAAQALGISIAKTRFIGWMVSAVLVGIGGAMWAMNSRAFAPDQFYFGETFSLLAMLVVGGIGSVSGGLVGALVITVVDELMRGVQDWSKDTGLGDLPGLLQLATAALIIIVLIFRPTGILGGRELGLAMFRRRS